MLKTVIVSISCLLFIVSCKHSLGDVKYEYHCKQGVTDTTLVFESQYELGFLIK